MTITHNQTELPGSAGLASALAALAETDVLLVALDFDGTVAPEVDDPMNARALPEAAAGIRALADLPRTRVALVSGRALDNLAVVSESPRGVLLVGSHGAEIQLGEPDSELDLTASESERLRTVGRILDSVAGRMDDVWVETKPAGFALHTRMATPEDSLVAHLVALTEAVSDVEGLTIRSGKDVVELSVRSSDKGEALRHLRQYIGATAVFFAGDDVTDEDAFAVLDPGDLGLKSGPGPTIADHRVAGPADVSAVLTRLVDLRRSR